MSDATLNEEIARLEIEIDAVRDELDEAIKRNEGLEAELIETRGRCWQLQSQTMEAEEEVAMLRGQRDAAIEDYNVLREALEIISDNGGDTLTIKDAVRVADAALTATEPKP